MAAYGHSSHAVIAPRPGRSVATSMAAARGGGAMVATVSVAAAGGRSGALAVPPPGTFTPGTKIQVGSNRVVIQKYLSEGGFAHVYLVKMAQPVDGTDLGVLKRVAVPDKDALRGMKTEVETMKRLKGHRPIVTYIDSHASELQGGGYEVFLLMEYCSGGGLIDFMNTRLHNRLVESEVIAIFADVAEGVACMHFLKPPLLHRDLKVENVLITQTPAPSGGAKAASVRRFKLCDFGSAAPPRPAPTTTAECRLVDEDVQKHTTLQYRSPEMVDVYRKQPLDEKSDIWALGVLLFKLCYYTTPFEDQGQLAILNASFAYPPYPAFSPRLKKLIGSMLQEQPEMRPNIFQVLKEACEMQGREVPVQDIYAARPSPDKPKFTPKVGVIFSPTVPQQFTIPNITPMRRGRPAAGMVAQSAVLPPNPSIPATRVTEGDPFAALDSSRPVNTGKADELSSRFPTLEQFSLLHAQGAQFDFDAPAALPQAEPTQALMQHVPDLMVVPKVTNRLTGEPYVAPIALSRTGGGSKSSTQANTASRPSVILPTVHPTPGIATPYHPLPVHDVLLHKAALVALNPDSSRAQTTMFQAPGVVVSPTPPKPRYISTGTMTMTPPLDRGMPGAAAINNQHGITVNLPALNSVVRASTLPRPPALDIIRPSDSSWAEVPHKASSLPSLQIYHPAQENSSLRSSLEEDKLDARLPLGVSLPGLAALARSRAASPQQESREAIDEPGGRGQKLQQQYQQPPISPTRGRPVNHSPPLVPVEGAPVAESSVEFPRIREESDGKRKEKTPGHGKKSGLGASLSGTKSLLAGKFGDAFKRFEANTASPPLRTPSPLKDPDRLPMFPNVGSDVTGGVSERDNGDRDEIEGRIGTIAERDMTQERRRELERDQLSEEERRVEAAQAEHRRRLAERDAVGAVGRVQIPPLPRSIGGVSRAVSIRNRVQNLLNEDQRASTTGARTAPGRGKYEVSSTVAAAGGTAQRPGPPGVVRRKLVTTGRPLYPPPDGFAGLFSSAPKPIAAVAVATAATVASHVPAPTASCDAVARDLSNRFSVQGSLEALEQDLPPGKP